MLAINPMTDVKTVGGRKAGATRPAESLAPRVLIWEDDMATVMALDRTFSAIGCRTRAVSFGNEAFLEFQAVAFDLVVMDYQLSFTDARRALDGVPEWVRLTTPFVLISAEDRRNEACDLGFSAFYQKPLLYETAQDILRRFVGCVPNAPALREIDDALSLPLSRRAHHAFDAA